MPVHNAVAAHINAHTHAMVQPASTTANHNNSRSQPIHQHAHTQRAPEQPEAQPPSTKPGMTLPLQQVPRMHRYEITASALLQGPRCYVDASTALDQPHLQPRFAGLGVFILNLQEQPAQAIYIKAKHVACTSVLMAEAASLALASAIIDRLNLTRVSYLSDCEQLVHFLNSDDLSNPPDWRIRYFTQTFSNHSRSSSSRVYKIHRRLNTTADALARQATEDSAIHSHNLELSCSFEHHVFQ